MANGAAPARAVTVETLLDKYLDWCEHNLAPPTFKKNGFHLKRFVGHIKPQLPATDVKPLHVQRWIDKQYRRKSPTYKNIAITAVKAAFNWAAEQGYIDHSPIAHLKKPPCTCREYYVPVIDWLRVVKAARGQHFKELLIVMLASGARPQEIRRVEASHYEANLTRLVLLREESKGKKRRRVIYLDDVSRNIVERLVQSHPRGPLFRNSHGRPWTSDALTARFRRLRSKLNMPKLCAYTLRHSYAHWQLTAGTDSHLVGKLLGHSDGRMLETRYGHIDHDVSFMTSTAKKARSPFEQREYRNSTHISQPICDHSNVTARGILFDIADEISEKRQNCPTFAPSLRSQNLGINMFRCSRRIKRHEQLASRISFESLEERVVLATTVFSSNFDQGKPAEFSGAGSVESVRAYDGVGHNNNVFSGSFLTNRSSARAVLTLSELPEHETVEINFLLALMESWDGSDAAAGPDYFNVAVDGDVVFSHSFSNFDTSEQSYSPPPGVQLESRMIVFGDQEQFPNHWEFDGWGDASYDMGQDPIFDAIPHTSDTLTIEWFANGDGFSGGNDELWGIDQVEVILDAGVCSNPTTGFETNFDQGKPAEFSGAGSVESVGAYDGVGVGDNVFSGDFLTNRTSTSTVLALCGLAEHESVEINFLLALMESWDGSAESSGPDYFNVAVDGELVFSHTFSNFDTSEQSYLPPPGVQLEPRMIVFGDQEQFPNHWGFDGWGDASYDMGQDPTFDAILHTAETLTIEWFASGDGFDGLNDELWAIDQVEVILDQTTYDCASVDALVGAIVAGDQSPSFDFTNDGFVNLEDLNEWLTLAGAANLPSGSAYLRGDTDLDGKVNSLDLNVLGLNWQQEASGWCAGDFTADGRVNANDLNALALNWQQDISGAAAADGRVPRAPFAAALPRVPAAREIEARGITEDRRATAYSSTSVNADHSTITQHASSDRLVEPEMVLAKRFTRTTGDRDNTFSARSDNRTVHGNPLPCEIFRDYLVDSMMSRWASMLAHSTL